MGDAGQDFILDIPENLRKLLALDGRSISQRGSDLTRLYLRQDGIALNLFIVIRNPVYHFLAVTTEILHRHVITF